MSRKKGNRRDPAYLIEQGNRDAKGKKQRKLTFSLIMQIPTQGQTIEQWNELGLWGPFLLTMKHIGQYSTQEALH